MFSISTTRSKTIHFVIRNMYSSTTRFFRSQLDFISEPVFLIQKKIISIIHHWFLYLERTETLCLIFVFRLRFRKILLTWHIFNREKIILEIRKFFLNYFGKTISILLNFYHMLIFHPVDITYKKLWTKMQSAWLLHYKNSTNIYIYTKILTVSGWKTPYEMEKILKFSIWLISN